ncbi:hypothetical protein Pelo_10201 [Pelomyxa schiedti]|nr:hypothetical protein Pelo_10201 [Pelomyxa schiedti]
MPKGSKRGSPTHLDDGIVECPTIQSPCFSLFGSTTSSAGTKSDAPVKDGDAAVDGSDSQFGNCYRRGQRNAYRSQSIVSLLTDAMLKQNSTTHTDGTTPKIHGDSDAESGSEDNRNSQSASPCSSEDVESENESDAAALVSATANGKVLLLSRTSSFEEAVKLQVKALNDVFNSVDQFCIEEEIGAPTQSSDARVPSRAPSPQPPKQTTPSSTQPSTSSHPIKAANKATKPALREPSQPTKEHPVPHDHKKNKPKSAAPREPQTPRKRTSTGTPPESPKTNKVPRHNSPETISHTTTPTSPNKPDTGTPATPQTTHEPSPLEFHKSSTQTPTNQQTLSQETLTIFAPPQSSSPLLDFQPSASKHYVRRTRMLKT